MDRRQANIFPLFLQVNSKNNCIYQKKLKGNLPDKDIFSYGGPGITQLHL